MSGTVALGLIAGVLALEAPASALAQGRCASAPSASRPATFGAGAADSPQLPGRVLVRFGGRFSCPENAEWWFEYGTSAQYGQRTESNDAAVPVLTTRGAAVVRTDVDGLSYGQTYHYRLVVRYPDGAVETGADIVVRVRPGALRPPQRVAFSWSRRPTPSETRLDTVSVLDALPGSKATVSCAGAGCKPFERRLVLGRGPTVFRNWRVQPPGHLTVVVAGKGVPTVTTIRPRPRSGPTLETECGGYPVQIGGLKCAAVSLTHRGRLVRRLSISNVTRGSAVQIACRGGGCPRRDFSELVQAPRARPYVDIAPRGYTGLRPGATLRVFITRPRTYGLTLIFRVTRETVIRGPYRCLSPRVPLRPIACPTAQQVTTGRGSAPSAGRSASAAAPASQAPWRLPPVQTVPFRTVAKGQGGGAPSGRRSLTIRGERRWRKLWDALGDGGEPPEIDFASEMLIAVTQGRQPSGGHAIRIERIERTGKGRLVKVVETQPARGCPASGVITSPYHVVRVRRSAQRVRFERRRTQRSCR
jgi:hypothetical protein